jgi:hypothetical protein
MAEPFTMPNIIWKSNIKTDHKGTAYADLKEMKMSQDRA